MATNTAKHSGALDAFLNLLSLVTLGWLAFAIGMICFQIIDKYLGPDNVVYYLNNFSQDRLKFGIASALIIAPIFLFVSAFLHKQYKQNKLNPASGIHTWLTYLMLFIAAIFIAGSLINIIFRFLNGDYTARSILRVLVVLLIAASIFGYYFYDLRRKSYLTKSQLSIVAFVGVILLVLILVIWGFVLVDSPAQSRAVNSDQQRANDLTQLNFLISSYYQVNGQLPPDLSVIGGQTYTDPVSGAPYGYNLVGDDTYELCAEFATDTSASVGQSIKDIYAIGIWYYHQAGYQCFQQKVAPTVNVKTAPTVPMVQ